MTRHLKTCVAPMRQFPEGKENGGFHLLVEGFSMRDYWLHVAVSSSCTLNGLDAFLRNIWLECCGHLSKFEFPNSSRIRDFKLDLKAAPDAANSALADVLKPEMEFTYEYDFGSTTKLSLKVLDTCPVGKGEIQLLARNEAPATACGTCGQPANSVCTLCSYDEQGWLCETCASKHECGEEMLLPVTNSPRCGVCAYMGDMYS